MPNHVTTKIEFCGDQKYIDKILERIKGEEECIDFEKIIPMPENIFRGNLGQEEREKYGANNWYDWSCDNWGTKWNAYTIASCPKSLPLSLLSVYASSIKRTPPIASLIISWVLIAV